MGKVRDPFALGVHRPVQPDYPQPGRPELPAYVPREHDATLAAVARAAVEGNSGIAVLVGGSSTGKTRACWEALGLLRGRKPGWRLWHPIGPSRPDAALRELPGVGPRTVVWLDGAQFYLDPPADIGLGERVATGLGELLRDPERAPVLVLATLWPQFWGDLTAHSAGSGDPRAEARELLAGHDIPVPAAFTSAQLQRLSQAGDARLAQAAAAQDGQVVQFLAGAPGLLARYRDAPPAAKAVIHAAMDARRLGMGQALPQAFLAAAAPGYLAGTGWDAMGEDWLEQALANLAVPRKGVRGPLTRIRPSRARSRAPGSRSPDSDERLAVGQADGRGAYQLADYLDQHGRADRKSQIPPAGFWAAAAGHALPGEQAALGDAAHARGLYRDAAQLHKNAAARGNLRAVSYLASPPPWLRADVRPVHWAVTHVLFDDPGAVAGLLDRLREAGEPEEVTALLARDPAAHIPLDDPDAVADLLGALREAEAQEQVTALLRRDPAAHGPVDDLYAVDHLLDELRGAGAQEQAAELARRAAAYVPLDEPDAVAWLLHRLLEAGAQEQVTVLVRRDPAAHVPLDDPDGVAWLLDKLREAGAQEQVTALLRRDPATHASLDDPEAVADLLYALRAVGAQDQVTALLRRDPAAHVSLRDPGAVAWLLPSLQVAGAQEQVIALAGRAAAQAPLDNPGAVARLLDNLREAGTQEQVIALAARAAAQAPLHDPSAVADLLDNLRQAETQEQVTTLLARDPAAHVSLDDPGAVADLLDRLQWAGAPEQVTALLARDPAAHVPLGDPGAIAWLLDRLRAAGAPEQVTTLLARDPASHVSLDDPGAVAWLLSRLRAAGAGEQATALAKRAARHTPLDDREAVAALLDRMRAAGEREPATVLAERLAGSGMFEFFREHEEDRFRFGQEPDGSPAGPWGWADLD